MTTSLTEFADQLTRVAIPLIIIIGVVSNSINIVVLTRPNLVKYSCSLYFIGHAVSSLFYSSVLLVYRLLADQYRMDLAKVSLVLCKTIVYINHLGIFLTPNFLILASIDRWCASSTNIHLRKFSNVKIARWMIFVTILLFSLIFINSGILVDLRDTDPYGCYIRADTLYKQVYVFVQASMLSFISPLLMALFGLLTIYNIKKGGVLPAVVSRDRRSGRELCLMLLVQVCTYIILNVPSSITYLIFVLPNDIKGTPAFYFASILSVLPFHLSYVTAFFLYILSARLYRKELLHLKNRIFRPCLNIQVHPIVNVNNRIPLAN